MKSAKQTIFGRYYLNDYTTPAFWNPQNALWTANPGNYMRSQSLNRHYPEWQIPVQRLVDRRLSGGPDARGHVTVRSKPSATERAAREHARALSSGHLPHQWPDHPERRTAMGTDADAVRLFRPRRPLPPASFHGHPAQHRLSECSGRHVLLWRPRNSEIL